MYINLMLIAKIGSNLFALKRICLQIERDSTDSILKNKGGYYV